LKGSQTNMEKTLDLESILHTESHLLLIVNFTDG